MSRYPSGNRGTVRRRYARGGNQGGRRRDAAAASSASSGESDNSERIVVVEEEVDQTIQAEQAGGWMQSIGKAWKSASIENKFMFAPPEASYAYDDYQSNIQWIEARDEDTGELEYMFPALFAPCRGARRLILYFHGNSEDLGDVGSRAALIANETECNVCAVEYPGYGPCAGKPTEESAVERGRRTLEYVGINFPVDYEAVILYGYSIGAAVAVKLARQLNSRIGGLVLQSPFLSIKRLMEHYAKKSTLASIASAFVSSAHFPSEEYVVGVTVPLLVVHGARDRVIPAEHGREMCTLCASRDKRFVLDKRGTHERFDRELLLRSLRAFVDRQCFMRDGCEVGVKKCYNKLGDLARVAVRESCKSEGARRSRAPRADHWL